MVDYVEIRALHGESWTGLAQLDITVNISEMGALCTIVSVTCGLFAAAIMAGELPRERIVYTSLRPANWELFLLDHGKPRARLLMIPHSITIRHFHRTVNGSCFVRSVPGTRIFTRLMSILAARQNR